MPGEAPAQLFCNLEAVRLGPFRVVGAKVDVRKAPVIAIRHLRTQPVHIVVVATDRDDARFVDRRSGDLAGLEIVRNEDGAGETEPCGMRRHAVGQVAGRGTGEDIEAEFDGAGGRNRDDAILVRAGRMVDRIVLDIQFRHPETPGKPIGAHERGEPGVQAGQRLLLNRQELAVAPQVFRARLDQLARDERRDRCIVVGDLERAQALVADPQRGCGKFRPAQVTSKTEVHAVLSRCAGDAGLLLAG